MQQTSFWGPHYLKPDPIMRIAFGMEYLVPRLERVTADLSQSGHQNEEHNTMEAGAPCGCLQRLCVFIQLKTSLDGLEEQPDPYLADLSDPKRFSLGNIMIVYDSKQDEVVSKPLVPEFWPWSPDHDRWSYIYEGCDPTGAKGFTLKFAVVQLLCEAVAGKWSDYILCMHAHIVFLEQKIYEKPANDKQAHLLWDVSKQILQAERLIKFHIILLENIQSNLGQFTCEPQEWLNPNITEFRRLSSEMEESLSKPVAHMVDLVSF